MLCACGMLEIHDSKRIFRFDWTEVLLLHKYDLKQRRTSCASRSAVAFSSSPIIPFNMSASAACTSANYKNTLSKVRKYKSLTHLHLITSSPAQRQCVAIISCAEKTLKWQRRHIASRTPSPIKFNIEQIISVRSSMHLRNYSTQLRSDQFTNYAIMLSNKMHAIAARNDAAIAVFSVRP